MELDVNGGNQTEQSPPNAQFAGGKASAFSSTLTLDHVGEVVLTFKSDELSWKLVAPFDSDDSTCLGIKFAPKDVAEIKFCDVYAVELINYGLIHGPSVSNAKRCVSGHKSETYRFTVHGFQKSKTMPSLRVLVVYTFGHKDLQTCQMWVNQINAYLALEQGRPKNLLVFVHPRSGKGNGCKTWESVAPIFSRAKVKTKVTVTQRAGQAFDVMASIGNKELISYDGVITVGGDGFFNEVLNGFLCSRHKAPYPPTPSGFLQSAACDDGVCLRNPIESVTGTSSQTNEQSPLLSSPYCDCSGVSNIMDQDPQFLFPNEHFRFGIIPAGSTDAIVMCTTGTRDPITSAFHIVLGKRVGLDVAQIVRWKKMATSKFEPCVRYAASFAGYGFYGDVINESEKYRWMGPKRYDFAGTRMFLRHRSYQAEISYLETNSEEAKPASERGNLGSRKRPFWSPNKSEQAICRVNCKVCSTSPCSHPGETKWSKSKGIFLSIGAAVIACRNEKAPDGLVADAHLSDGFMHLILIKDCSHALYLWHLTQLAKKGGDPFDFKFVEHHKTTAFTFTSSGNESVWNLDGEIFQAHQLSAQVFRGLVNLFAAGPEENINLELEKIRIELRHVKGMCAVAQSKTVDASRKINNLNKRRLEEAIRLKEINCMEEKAKELATQEKEKYEAAQVEVDYMKECVEREVLQRRETELKAMHDAKEKQKLENVLVGPLQKYQKFTWDEIVTATSSFSENFRIGMGAYATVYKCSFHHTTAAVKVLHSKENHQTKQFQQELDVLSKIRHPHLLLLLGACPDHSCLLYEYMENGSLEDRLLQKNGTNPISWFDRFRIAWEVASALVFLHSTKPKPIIHRDLKPANILLDHKFVSKIGDVGLSTMLNLNPSMSSIYNDTGPVGTLSYIDPECQRTGIISPKSDVYAFGMVILQLLTAKPARAITHLVETAVNDKNLMDVLDPKAGLWPLEETRQFSELGLSCAELRRRDRPDLKEQVVPLLERLKEVAWKARDSASTVQCLPPNHFICPILKDVMNDPCVAADGYT